MRRRECARARNFVNVGRVLVNVGAELPASFGAQASRAQHGFSPSVLGVGGAGGSSDAESELPLPACTASPSPW